MSSVKNNTESTHITLLQLIQKLRKVYKQYGDLCLDYHTEGVFKHDPVFVLVKDMGAVVPIYISIRDRYTLKLRNNEKII